MYFIARKFSCDCIKLNNYSFLNFPINAIDHIPGVLLKASDIVDNKIEILREYIAKNNLHPQIKIIRVGEDSASVKYVNNKIKICQLVGITSFVTVLPVDCSEQDILIEIDHSTEKNIPTLVQLPLPAHIDENKILKRLPYFLDVDGFSEINLGRLMRHESGFIPCTPKGIITLLKYYNIDLSGKDVVIINRSNIVGKPLSLLMLNENATVTICHSKTKDLKNKVKNADIVISAVGIANFFSAKDFSDNTTIVDVSINVNESGKICGDVRKEDYEKLLNRNCNITPVPGGIGPMTVLSLMENSAYGMSRG